MTEALLQVSGLRAGYGQTVVLDGVSLELAPGEALAVLGRNGVGKSTLLNSLLGRTTHHAGTVRLGQRNVLSLAPHQRARAGLGLVPQEREIFRSLTVEENLRVACRPGPWTVERVYELFPRLRERRSNLGHQLSGGEQQMLAIGRALAGNPAVVLFDEPFEGLAPVIVDLLVDAFLMLRKQAGLAVVLVEQHAELALELTDRALVLDRGQVVWSGASAELARDAARLAELVGVAAPECEA